MQRSILPNLLEAFPNVKFIISTHSPLVVGSVKDSTTYALKYNDNKKIQSHQLNFQKQTKNAIEILDEVLGVSFTMPIWVENELEKIRIKEYKSYNDFIKDITKVIVISFKTPILYQFITFYGETIIPYLLYFFNNKKLKNEVVTYFISYRNFEQKVVREKIGQSPDMNKTKALKILSDKKEEISLLKKGIKEGITDSISIKSRKKINVGIVTLNDCFDFFLEDNKDTIICVPFVSLIKNKMQKYNTDGKVNVLGVYEGVTTYEIREYLNTTLIPQYFFL